MTIKIQVPSTYCVDGEDIRFRVMKIDVDCEKTEEPAKARLQEHVNFVARLLENLLMHPVEYKRDGKLAHGHHIREIREWADELAQDSSNGSAIPLNIYHYANLLEGAFAQDVSELESVNQAWQNKCDDLCDKANAANKHISDLEKELDELKNNHLPKVENALRRANEAGMACDAKIAELKGMLGGDVKTEYVTGRRIDETHVVYYESKSETAEEAKRGIPPNNPNYFVAMRKVTPYVEVKV